MKIAIVKLSALGDIVHAMVVLQLIKKQFPHYRIEWIVEECFAGLLEHNPDIDAVHTVNLKALKKNKKQFFSELQQLKSYAQNSYDIVIDMQGLLKSAIVSKILGKNIGFDKHSTREKIAAWFYHQSFLVPYEKNVILRNIDLVSKALDFEVTPQMIQKKKTFLFFTQNDTRKVEKYVTHERANIVYILGSSWQSKVYPKEKFVEVINGLEGNHLLIWGTEEEYTYAKYIAEHTVATVVEKMDLNALKALVSKADLVIGADSGPTHFAWALNRPSITIFGPTPSARNVLETPINKVIDCGKKINPLKLDKEETCIGDIYANRIVTLAKELLL